MLLNIIVVINYILHSVNTIVFIKSKHFYINLYVCNENKINYVYDLSHTICIVSLRKIIIVCCFINVKREMGFFEKNNNWS